MQYRFLVWDKEENKIYLLGYELRLSPSERQILKILLDQESATFEEIQRFSNPSIPRNSISVHVYSINQKAIAISGRKLIVFDRGYYHIIASM